MDSAQKALDALAVPPDRRWVPDTWCNDDGEWVARGPTRVNRMPTPILGESDDDYADRCLDADSSEPGCDADQQAQADAERACLSVNLAAPLAAVVRAVADRPWWTCPAVFHRIFAECSFCHAELAKRGDPFRHRAGCRHAPADAALDAFAVAAQEMFP